jgi:quercetin dioxygenase-like cupin family protein
MGYDPGMIRKANPRGYQLVLPGIERKTLAYGEHTLMTEFRMRKGSSLPPHAHPHEQTGYLVSGRLRLSIAGRKVEMRPGDSWAIPGGALHGAAILADSVAIEVFSPVREDYLVAAKPRASKR